MMIFLSFMNLFRNSRRTLAILLTIALGTGVLFSFKGFIHGVLNQYKDSTIHAHYGHGQINTKNYRESVYAEPWKHWMANWMEIKDYLSNQKKVAYIFPRVSLPGLLKHGNVTVGGTGQGINAEQEALFFHGLRIESGESLSTQENGLQLGIGLAKALGVKPGDEVTLMVNSVDGNLNQANFKVVGLSQTGSLDFDNRMFRVQLDQAQSLLNTKSIESISIGLKDDADWDGFESEFEKTYPDLEATSFTVLDKVYYQHSVDWLNAQFHVIQFIILSIVLLGIFNSVSASVLERKQEIGNFRANGESIGNVMQLITSEGTFLGLLGSCLGIAVTYAVLKLFLDNGIQMPPGPGLTRPFFVSFQFEWKMVYTTFGLSTAASVIASMLAGLRVAKMPIAQALRSH
jgi:putative ABC transport system permease protein